MGLVVAYGPELRAFVYSGLLDALIVAGIHPTLYVPERVDLSNTGLPSAEVFRYPLSGQPCLLRKVRGWATSAARRLALSRGQPGWQHAASPNRPPYQGTGPGTGRASTALWRTVSSCLANLERLMARILGPHPHWKAIFLQQRIRAVVAASFDSPRLLPVLQSASLLGLKTIVLCNSWKDVYVASHLSANLDLIGVQNTDAERHLSNLPGAIPARIRVIPSLHLQPFMRSLPAMSRPLVAERLGLISRRTWICYSFAAPGAVTGEISTVRTFALALRRIPTERRPQLVLRENPMAPPGRLASLAAEIPEAVVFRPDWFFEPKMEWCCPSRSDSVIWPAFVRECALNVSIPSTVTLEFAAAGRPVINVCFDTVQGVTPGESAARLWNAPFYQDIRESKIAQPARSPTELIALTQRILTDSGVPADHQGPHPEPPVEAACRAIVALVQQ